MSVTVVGLLHNVLDLTCELPYELAPGYLLERADEDLLQSVHSYARMIGAEGYLAKYIYPYVEGAHFVVWNGEFKPVRHDSDGSLHPLPPLPKEQWRHYMIKSPPVETFESAQNDMRAIEAASMLCDTPLKLSVLGARSGTSPTSVHPRDYLLLQPVIRKIDPSLYLRPFDANIAGDVRKMLDLLAKADKEHPEIVKSVALYLDLEKIPPESPMYVLGLFAVLESLITHKQVVETDTLSHQIQTKMIFLGRRVEKPLDYAPFPKKFASPSRVWKEFYGWRSNIAHGDAPTKGIELGDITTAAEWLNVAVRLVLRYALRDPQTVKDLKAI